jgi:hypothetical protein
VAPFCLGELLVIPRIVLLMDNLGQEGSSPVSVRRVISWSSRNKTTPGDLESRTSSGRSNGRSSVDSTPDKSRPKTSAGVGQDDSIKGGVSGISRLLPNRRKKKRLEASQQSAGNNSGKIAPQMQEDIPAFNSSVDGSLSARELFGENNGLLTDDSEPDQ